MGRAVTLALWRAISKPPVELVVADLDQSTNELIIAKKVMPAKKKCKKLSTKYEIRGILKSVIVDNFLEFQRNF